MLDPRQAKKAKKVLAACSSLTEAETQLASLTPIPSKAVRWGLWDGWSGRPETTAGLKTSREEEWTEIEFDYRQACELGRRLAVDDLPR